MKTTILAVALLLIPLAPQSRSAEITAEKREQIQKMLRLTGMENLMDQMKLQMLSSLRGQLTEVPEAFWSSFEKRMDMRELIEKMIPLYDKYYTLEDLKAINSFYESPAGKKILATLPQIMQEGMKIGEEWGRRIGEQAAAEAQALLENKESPPK